MASTSLDPVALRQKLEGLSKEQSELSTKLDSLLDQILTADRPDKNLFTEVETLEEREAELVVEKQKIREDLIAAKAEAVLNNEEKERRRLTISRKKSSFLLGGTNSALSQTGPNVEPTGFLVESSSWEIKPEDITIDESQVLGRGQFGTVYIGKLKGKEVAVKKLLVQSFKDAKIEEEFKKEVKIMSSLRHTNLLLFMGACLKPGNLMMVTEVMSRGTVYGLLHTKDPNKALQFREKMLIAKGTAQGLSWLHQMTPAILHLDLKTANLLVDENGVVKVADFGLSQIKKDQNFEKVGSPYYMAPEMLRGESYDAKADVYSFGICLWELLTEKDPYDNAITSLPDLIQQVAIEGRRPAIPDKTVPRFKILIEACLDQIPANRPDFAKMLKENVFDEIILDTLISDENNKGRQFWRSQFPGKWVIPWESFLRSVSMFCRWIPNASNLKELEVKLKCLQAVLQADGTSKQLVTIESFGHLLDWFGPLDTHLLDRVESVISGKWFWGYMSSSAADNVLEGKGSYLIRFSNTERGGYVISIVNKEGKVAHIRFSYNVASGRYIFGKSDYETIDHILKGKQIKLHKVSPKKPCGHERPYERLFLGTRLDPGNYYDPNFT